MRFQSVHLCNGPFFYRPHRSNPVMGGDCNCCPVEFPSSRIQRVYYPLYLKRFDGARYSSECQPSQSGVILATNEQSEVTRKDTSRDEDAKNLPTAANNGMKEDRAIVVDHDRVTCGHQDVDLCTADVSIGIDVPPSDVTQSEDLNSSVMDKQESETEVLTDHNNGEELTVRKVRDSCPLEVPDVNKKDKEDVWSVVLNGEKCRPEDIDVRVVGSCIVVRGDSVEIEDDHGSYRTSFQRRIPVPNGVKSELIKCEMRGGNIVLSAPRMPQTSREINVPIRSSP